MKLFCLTLFILLSLFTAEGVFESAVIELTDDSCTPTDDSPTIQICNFNDDTLAFCCKEWQTCGTDTCIDPTDDDHDDDDHDDDDHDDDDHDDDDPVPTDDPATNDDSTGCFSDTETVRMESGVEVLISDLNIGDRVLSWSGAEFTYSEVVFLPHAKNNKGADFVQVTFQSGRIIKMTSSHIVPAGACSSKAELPLVSAEELVHGLCVRSLLGLDKIMVVERVKGKGIYTFVTNDEFIVVNGVVASPFASNHFVVNKFYNIHRAIYALFPSVLSNPNFKVGELTSALGAIVLGVMSF